MFNFVITSYIGGKVTSSRVVGNIVGNVYKTILSGTTEAINIYKNDVDIIIVPSSNAEFRISFDACETESTLTTIDVSSIDLSEYLQL